MDGDVDTDLVIVGPGIRLLTHGAGSSFTASTVSADTSLELGVGDLDGDGDIDVAGFSGHTVNVYHRDGATWTRTQHDTGPAGDIRSIAVADVTGDGRLDVIAAVPAANPVLVLAQQADGTLATPVGYWSQGATNLAAADLDADGRSDVVAVNGIGSGAVNVLLQRPDGTLGSPLVRSVADAGDSYGQQLALGDVDSDGRPDVVYAGFNSDVAVLRNSSPPRDDERQFVRDVTPADAATAVPLGVAPKVTFQVPVDPATVHLLDGRTGAAVPATVTYASATNVATVTPTSPLRENTPYRIVAPGFTSTFRTVDAAPAALDTFGVLGRGPSGVALSWSIPPIADLQRVIVRISLGTSPPGSPPPGLEDYTGTDSAVTFTTLNPGTTYSFAAWVVDRAGNFSPPRTATLLGTELSMALASGSSTVTAGSTVAFSSHVTVRNGSNAGRPATLVGSCRGGPTRFVAGQATSNAGGDLALTVVQTLPSCYYQWEIVNAAGLMGAVSEIAQVDTSIPPPPGGPPPRGR